MFNINLYASTYSLFRFAVDNINNGVLGMNYIAKLETLGGRDPVVFSVLPGTATLNGAAVAPVNSLEALGLSLTTAGTLYGRPLQVGQITFMAQAEDKFKRIAVSRT